MDGTLKNQAHRSFDIGGKYEGSESFPRNTKKNHVKWFIQKQILLRNKDAAENRR